MRLANVEGQNAIVVWMKGAEPHLTLQGTAFTRAVRLSGLGKTQEKRDFLGEKCEDTAITEKNSERHSCTAVFLSLIPKDLASQLRKGINIIA